MALKINVYGAGLAGCEAAWQAAKYGAQVDLYEMKPLNHSPAHKSDMLAELVCSNSLRSDRLTNAVGLLKEEMRILGSLIMNAADETKVPAGGALAVDRNLFSKYITDAINENPNINLITKEITDIPNEIDIPTIVATGPLTSDELAKSIQNLPGLQTLSFYDAAAPIIMADSINMDKVFRMSRYGRGSDYLNCPMDKKCYDNFIEKLVAAETAPIKGFEEKSVFEGCMPVESMAKRGHETLAFGPLKPVGLEDPTTGEQYYAVVQLRQDNEQGTMYNMVGFQTRLKFPAQREVFGLIPGLENAEFARFGVMHRNTFLHSPGFLNDDYTVIGNEKLAFAGQMTGVEGYVESAASGLYAGLNMALKQQEKEVPQFSGKNAISAMAKYISHENRKFQPMNCTFGLIDVLEGKRIRKKLERYEKISQRAIEEMLMINEELKKYQL